jgi:hypothetical protein
MPQCGQVICDQKFKAGRQCRRQSDYYLCPQHRQPNADFFERTISVLLLLQVILNGFVYYPLFVLLYRQEAKSMYDERSLSLALSLIAVVLPFILFMRNEMDIKPTVKMMLLNLAVHPIIGQVSVYFKFPLPFQICIVLYATGVLYYTCRYDKYCIRKM